MAGEVNRIPEDEFQNVLNEQVASLNKVYDSPMVAFREG